MINLDEVQRDAHWGGLIFNLPDRRENAARRIRYEARRYTYDKLCGQMWELIHDRVANCRVDWLCLAVAHGHRLIARGIQPDVAAGEVLRAARTGGDMEDGA